MISYFRDLIEPMVEPVWTKSSKLVVWPSVWLLRHWVERNTPLLALVKNAISFFLLVYKTNIISLLLILVVVLAVNCTYYPHSHALFFKNFYPIPPQHTLPPTTCLDSLSHYCCSGTQPNLNWLHLSMSTQLYIGLVILHNQNY